MNAAPVTTGGADRQDGEHGGKACGGFRLVDQTQKEDGCHHPWAYIGGDCQRMIL